MAARFDGEPTEVGQNKSALARSARPPEEAGQTLARSARAPEEAREQKMEGLGEPGGPGKAWEGLGGPGRAWEGLVVVLQPVVIFSSCRQPVVIFCNFRQLIPTHLASVTRFDLFFQTSSKRCNTLQLLVAVVHLRVQRERGRRPAFSGIVLEKHDGQRALLKRPSNGNNILRKERGWGREEGGEGRKQCWGRRGAPPAFAGPQER